jgi:hypothetical protein
VSEVLNRFLSNCDEFGNKLLIVNISIEISLSVVKLAELICSIIILGDLWKLEAFFLENLLGVDFKNINWVNSFCVDFGPLLHGVCVVRHIEISAEQVPFFIHLGNISRELFLLLLFDLSQFLESCLLFFLNFGKFFLILFLLLSFLVELFLHLNLHSRNIKIGSGDGLSNLMLRVFMNYLQFLSGLVNLLSHNLFTSWMWFVL